jgi:hypothetical protein
VAIQTAASVTPTYGVVWFTARTEVDKQAGMATLDDCRITKSSLPAGPGSGPDDLQLLRQNFARIPATHPAGDALPAVPGTSPARQALIAQSIPQTATVRRAEAQLTVTYDGGPRFRRIEGTSLQYAVNTPTPVIRERRHTYYACENGVWFRASSPTGPWVVATSVPGVIYTIPISSPLNYVTNVVVYDSTPDVVYVGYTPGYLGTYVAADNCIVFGSGYRYPSWIGDVWFGAPVTYGFGVAFDWDAGFGWEWGFGWGLGPWLDPWWGPWWGHWRDWDPGHPWWRNGDHFAGRPWDLNHFDVYNHWGRPVLVGHGFRPAAVTGLRPTGSPLRRPVPGTLPRGDGNLFAGRDGRVYRPGANGWEVHDGAGWHGIGARNPDLGRGSGSLSARAPSITGEPQSGMNGPEPGRGAFGGFGRRGGFGGGGFGGARAGGFGGGGHFGGGRR